MVARRPLPLGSRPHRGKLTILTPPEMISGYARAGDFERLMCEHDPAGNFRDAFVDGLFGTPFGP